MSKLNDGLLSLLGGVSSQPGSFLIVIAGVVVVFVAICVLTVKHLACSKQLGPPGWSFNSWASNITIFTAVLAGISSAANPGQARTLAGLNLLFGASAVVAPLLFEACSTIDKPANGGERKYRGSVPGFVASAALTLWAVTGQLCALAALGQHANFGALCPWIWALFAAVTIVLVFKYACTRIRDVLEPGTSDREALVSGAVPRRWTVL